MGLLLGETGSHCLACLLVLSPPTAVWTEAQNARARRECSDLQHLHSQDEKAEDQTRSGA